MLKSFLRSSWLLPCGLVFAAACGGKSFQASEGAGGAGAAAGQSAGGAGASGAGVAGSTSAGASSGGASSGGASFGGASSAGAAGLGACQANADCQVVPIACCSCGFGPASSYTAINTRFMDEYQARCDAVLCGGCPPIVPQFDNPASYYVATCREGLCRVVDLRATEATKCVQNADCRLRAGAGCCESCGGGTVISLSSPVGDIMLQKLVCDGDTGCPDCAPSFDGYATRCNEGQCAVEPDPCPPGTPCPNGG